MVIAAFLSWWYGPGWAIELTRVREQLARAADTFSIGLLFMTLFSPFRQISAGRVDGPLGILFQAWLDRIISRFIGAMIRSFMIVFGGISLLTLSILGGLRLVVWPALPVLPVVCIVAAVFGWFV